jgi:hypothetical protein
VFGNLLRVRLDAAFDHDASTTAEENPAPRNSIGVR